MATSRRHLALAASTLLLAAAPWLLSARPGWVAAALAAALVLWRFGASSSRPVVGAAVTVVGVAAAVALAGAGGWPVATGWCVAAAVAVALAAAFPQVHARSRPDAVDVAALVLYSLPLAMRPGLVAVEAGGWLAPLLLIAAAAQGGRLLAAATPQPARPDLPGPPSREARGSLTLDGVVIARAGTPATVPLDLEVRAGETVAVLVDDRALAEAAAAVLCGRVRPLRGELLVDGEPLTESARLVASIGRSERFLAGDLALNLGALCSEEPEPETLLAVEDGCGLGDVVTALAGRPLAGDGAPLGLLHRCLVLAARVVPSSYRVVVVLDPELWLNEVEAELWRRALVRAAVGRTTVWLTGDRALAERAGQVLVLRHGALRPWQRTDATQR